MESYQDLINAITITLGASWASGINLYATLLVCGLAGATGHYDLPPDLAVLSNPLVILGAGIMFVVEFIIDKIPGVDSAWDAVHTFVRIPAGAAIAAGFAGDAGQVNEIVAGILGGGMTASAHAAKASTRALINTSPEPFSNWITSITEDIAVIGALWTAVNHPFLLLGFLAVFLILLAWLLPKVWRGFRRIFRFLSGQSRREEATRLNALKDLAELRASGALSEVEFEAEKQKLLNATD